MVPTLPLCLAVEIIFKNSKTPLIKDRLNISLSSLGALGTALGSSAGMLL